MAHASRFVPPGSVRIASTGRGDPALLVTEDEERAGAVRVGIAEANVLPNVAFRTPDGKVVLVVANDSASVRSVRVQHRGRYATVPLEPGAVATLVW